MLKIFLRLLSRKNKRRRKMRKRMKLRLRRRRKEMKGSRLLRKLLNQTF
jgi:hypothetical protein